MSNEIVLPLSAEEKAAIEYKNKMLSKARAAFAKDRSVQIFRDAEGVALTAKDMLAFPEDTRWERVRENEKIKKVLDWKKISAYCSAALAALVIGAAAVAPLALFVLNPVGAAFAGLGIAFLAFAGIVHLFGLIKKFGSPETFKKEIDETIFEDYEPQNNRDHKTIFSLIADQKAIRYVVSPKPIVPYKEVTEVIAGQWYWTGVQAVPALLAKTARAFADQGYQVHLMDNNEAPKLDHQAIPFAFRGPEDQLFGLQVKPLDNQTEADFAEAVRLTLAAAFSSEDPNSRAVLPLVLTDRRISFLNVPMSEIYNADQVSLGGRQKQTRNATHRAPVRLAEDFVEKGIEKLNKPVRRSTSPQL